MGQGSSNMGKGSTNMAPPPQQQSQQQSQQQQSQQQQSPQQQSQQQLQPQLQPQQQPRQEYKYNFLKGYTTNAILLSKIESNKDYDLCLASLCYITSESRNNIKSIDGIPIADIEAYLKNKLNIKLSKDNESDNKSNIRRIENILYELRYELIKQRNKLEKNKLEKPGFLRYKDPESDKKIEEINRMLSKKIQSDKYISTIQYNEYISTSGGKSKKKTRKNHKKPRQNKPKSKQTKTKTNQNQNKTKQI
jgi:hypothetical protein